MYCPVCQAYKDEVEFEQAKAKINKLEAENERFKQTLYHFMEHVEELLGDWSVDASEFCDDDDINALLNYRDAMRKEASE